MIKNLPSHRLNNHKHNKLNRNNSLKKHNKYKNNWYNNKINNQQLIINKNNHHNNLKHNKPQSNLSNHVNSNNNIIISFNLTDDVDRQVDSVFSDDHKPYFNHSHKDYKKLVDSHGVLIKEELESDVEDEGEINNFNNTKLINTHSIKQELNSDIDINLLQELDA